MTNVINGVMSETEQAVHDYLFNIGVGYTCQYLGERQKGFNGESWPNDAWHTTFTSTSASESFEYFTGTGCRKIPESRALDVRKISASKDHPSRKKLALQALEIPVRPCAASVLYSLTMDSQAINTSFDYWCADYGYDTDSMAAFRIYQACCDNAKKLFRVFTRAQVAAIETMLQDY